MTHTKGPWKIANSGYANAPSVVYVGEKSPDFGARYPLQGCDYIAEVREDESPRGREFHANTRLIAAAPELLEALKTLLDITPFAKNKQDAQVRLDARNAIRKAEGGA